MAHTDYHLENSIERQMEDDYRDVGDRAGLNANALNFAEFRLNYDHGLEVSAGQFRRLMRGNDLSVH
jgi:hypothetical protein